MAKRGTPFAAIATELILAPLEPLRFLNFKNGRLSLYACESSQLKPHITPCLVRANSIRLRIVRSRHRRGCIVENHFSYKVKLDNTDTYGYPKPEINLLIVK